MDQNNGASGSSRPKIMPPYSEKRSTRESSGNREAKNRGESIADTESAKQSTPRPGTNREEQPRKRFKEDHHPPSYPGYSGYTPTSEHPQPQQPQVYVDGNRRPMNMMPAYNMITTSMNPQWGSMEGMGMTMAAGNMIVNSAAPTAMAMAPGMEMSPNSGAGMNAFSYMDPNMLGMMGYSQYGMIGGPENMVVNPVRDVVHLTRCTLYPPAPNAPSSSTTRERPSGCKTVFVGGLPEKGTEEMVKEIFEQCGEVVTVRMGKKNCCHVRFASEAAVDHAIYFSGYRVKVENKDEPGHSGKLHVDYAIARDDLAEHESKDTQERAHLESDGYQSSSPSSIPPFNSHEAGIIDERLKNKETFHPSLGVLNSWLERGECTKRTSDTMYGLMQSMMSSVHRIMNEKFSYEDDFNKSRLHLKDNLQNQLTELRKIVKAYFCAALQKNWDHFTKAQRRNVIQWKVNAEAVKNDHSDEVLDYRVEDEMELSDDSCGTLENPCANVQDNTDMMEELKRLREENEALSRELEATQNEREQLEAEHKQEMEARQYKLKVYKEVTDKTRQEIEELKEKQRLEQEATLNKQKARIERDAERSKSGATEVNEAGGVTLSQCEYEARLISLISTFLSVHPFGASIDYICSYLHQTDPDIKVRDVENLMYKFPLLFREESTGIGARLEKKWIFIIFRVCN